MADLFGKTKIEGTIYDITSGTTLINGVAHPITIGKTLKDGTTYEINKKYTLKDLLQSSLSYRGTSNHSSSLYQITYNNFSSSNAGETWYCFATDGPRLQITKVNITSNGVNFTQLKNWAKGSLYSALTSEGFTIKGMYTYGGLFIFIKFNSYAVDIVDEILSNCQGEVIQGVDQNSTIDSVITIDPSKISSSGLLFCSFAYSSNSRWGFYEANSPTTSVCTYMGEFVDDKSLIINYNNQYALSADGSSTFTYRTYGYTIARIY